MKKKTSSRKRKSKLNLSGEPSLLMQPLTAADYGFIQAMLLSKGDDEVALDTRVKAILRQLRSRKKKKATRRKR